MKKFLFLSLFLVSCIILQAARHQWILKSNRLAKPDTVWAFTPDGYSSHPEKKYPVVYLLHGWSGNYHQWDEIMGCQKYANKYGFILVCPDALYNSWYINSPAIKNSQYSDFFFLELFPSVEKKFRVDRNNIFITGLSMGGHGALYLFAQKPELFRSAGSLSGVVDLNSCPGDYELPEYLGLQHSPDDMAILTAYSVKGNIDKIARAGKEIIFSCGVSDRFYISNNTFRQQCDQLGIKATYISGPGGHDYHYWKANINSHLEFFAGKIIR